MVAVSANVVCWRCGECGHVGAQFSEGTQEQNQGKGGSSSTGNRGGIHNRKGSGKEQGGSCFVWIQQRVDTLSGFTE